MFFTTHNILSHFVFYLWQQDMCNTLEKGTHEKCPNEEFVPTSSSLSLPVCVHLCFAQECWGHDLSLAPLQMRKTMLERESTGMSWAETTFPQVGRGGHCCQDISEPASHIYPGVRSIEHSPLTLLYCYIPTLLLPWLKDITRLWLTLGNKEVGIIDP